MIYVVGGDLGSGKTLWSLEQMRQAVAAGRPVYTNIQLTEKCPYYADVALIDTDEYPVVRGEPGKPDYCAWWHYALPDSLIVVDEADIYLDCTDNSKMGRDARAAHKMIRKVGWDVIYIVQNVPNLYVRIRRLASRFIICEHNFRTERMFRIIEQWFGFERAIRMSRFLRAEYGSEDLSPSSCRGGGYYSYAEASTYFGWYETRQILGDLSFYRNRHKLNQGKCNAESGDAGGAEGTEGRIPRGDGSRVESAASEAVGGPGGVGGRGGRGLRADESAEQLGGGDLAGQLAGIVSSS